MVRNLEAISAPHADVASQHRLIKRLLYYLSDPGVPLVLLWITVKSLTISRDKTNLSHDGLNPAHVPC